MTTPALVREIEGVRPSISLPPALHLSSLRFASTASGQISMASAVNPVTQKIKCPSKKAGSTVPTFHPATGVCFWRLLGNCSIRKSNHSKLWALTSIPMMILMTYLSETVNPATTFFSSAARLFWVWTTRSTNSHCVWRHPHLCLLGMKEISENSPTGRRWWNCRSAAE